MVCSSLPGMQGSTGLAWRFTLLRSCVHSSHCISLALLPGNHACTAFTLHACTLCALQALTTKEKIAHMKAAMPANVAKAMGRLSSGLYIVTAQQENARRCAVLFACVPLHTWVWVVGVVCAEGLQVPLQWGCSGEE